jgi:VanZ family protein
LCWLLAVFYAVTDELHQSFVPGRHPSLWDVILFDNFGALISLWLTTKFEKQKRPDPIHPIVEEINR